MVEVIHLYEYRAKKNTKNAFKKDVFQLMNNAFFGKVMEHVKIDRNIKLITTKVRSNYLVSEPNQT